MKPILLFFFLLISPILNSQQKKIILPDSIIFSGTHFSFSGFSGYAQPGIVRRTHGVHTLDTPLNVHYNFGFAWTLWSKKNPEYISAGLKADLWFETYRLNIMKNNVNHLLFDINEKDHDYNIESYYCYFEYGRRFSLGKKFYLIPGIAFGAEYVHPFDFEFDESQSDTSGNTILLLHFSASNKNIPRLHFRTHADLGFAYLLPYGHIVSVHLIGSWSTGKIEKGHYVIVPGTQEKSKGHYNLKGSYAGIGLTYTFTNSRKKKMALGNSFKQN